MNPVRDRGRFKETCSMIFISIDKYLTYSAVRLLDRDLSLTG